MANKPASFTVRCLSGLTTAMLFAGVFYLSAEIIPVSRIRKEKKEFVMSRDIFSPFKQKTVISNASESTNPQPPTISNEMTEPEPPKVNPADEVKRNLIYEGYVLGSDRALAVVTYNGESFFLGVQELIFDRIKIIKIEKTSVTVEVDGIVVEINIKGDNENVSPQPLPQEQQQVQYEEQ